MKLREYENYLAKMLFSDLTSLEGIGIVRCFVQCKGESPVIRVVLFK